MALLEYLLFAAIGGAVNGIHDLNEKVREESAKSAAKTKAITEHKPYYYDGKIFYRVSDDTMLHRRERPIFRYTTANGRKRDYTHDVLETWEGELVWDFTQARWEKHFQEEVAINEQKRQHAREIGQKYYITEFDSYNQKVSDKYKGCDLYTGNYDWKRASDNCKCIRKPNTWDDDFRIVGYCIANGHFHIFADTDSGRYYCLEYEAFSFGRNDDSLSVDHFAFFYKQYYHIELNTVEGGVCLTPEECIRITRAEYIRWGGYDIEQYYPSYTVRQNMDETEWDKKKSEAYDNVQRHIKSMQNCIDLEKELRTINWMHNLSSYANAHTD